MPIVISQPQKAVEVTSPAKLSPTKGTIFWSEGFESNVLKFTGSTIINTAQLVRSGIYALNTASAAGGAFTTTSNCDIAGVSSEMFNTRCSLDLFCLFPAVTTAAAGLSSGHYLLDFYDGVTRHMLGVRVKFGAAATDAKLQYYNSAGVWTDIAGAVFGASTNNYFHLKLTFDPVNKKYVKVEWCNATYDLSAITYFTQASVYVGARIQIEVIGIDATTKAVNTDDVLLTYNEW